jgi:hypothetical protein
MRALGFEEEGACKTSIYASSTGTIRFRSRLRRERRRRLLSEEKPKRFTYTDSNGRAAPIYLRLDQVVAIIVTPAGTSTSEGLAPPGHRQIPDLPNPAA